MHGPAPAASWTAPQEPAQPSVETVGALMKEIDQEQQIWETRNAKAVKELATDHARLAEIKASLKERVDALKASLKARVDALKAEADVQSSAIIEAGKERIRANMRLRDSIRMKQALAQAKMEQLIPQGRGIFKVTFENDHLGKDQTALTTTPVEEAERFYEALTKPAEREADITRPHRVTIELPKEPREPLLNDEEAIEAGEEFGESPEWANAMGMSVIAVIPGNRIMKSVATRFGGIRIGAVRMTAQSNLDEGATIHNVSRIGDKAFELVLDKIFRAESSYLLRKAGWIILETPAPVYQVVRRNNGMSVTEEDTYARWEQEARRSRSPRAREYYRTLLEMHREYIY
ncbi:hypothetical protein LPJ81_001870 [Coemansia sp. IMI 209127]|nr:hypothetical protein LPJ81_001870 [Coemansia sp. IMI 209127]